MTFVMLSRSKIFVETSPADDADTDVTLRSRLVVSYEGLSDRPKDTLLSSLPDSNSRKGLDRKLISMRFSWRSNDPTVYSSRHSYCDAAESNRIGSDRILRYRAFSLPFDHPLPPLRTARISEYLFLFTDCVLPANNKSSDLLRCSSTNHALP